MSGPLDGALENASYWPSHVSLCPSLCLLCAALTQLVGFAFKPRALQSLSNCGTYLGYGYCILCYHS
jgi:hypothetical protein